MSGQDPGEVSPSAEAVAKPATKKRSAGRNLPVAIASGVVLYAWILGSLFGKHKMAPHISPGKTWEGLAGAVALTCIVGAVLGPVMIGASWWAGAIIGVVLPLAATVGDLIESMIKRDTGIKDMGRIIPGHGGAMDRLDSLLVAAPLAWLTMLVLV